MRDREEQSYSNLRKWIAKRKPVTGVHPLMSPRYSQQQPPVPGNRLKSRATTREPEWFQKARERQRHSGITQPPVSGNRPKSRAKGDSLLENAAEFVDPTGLLSHNDAAEAKEAYNRGEISEAELRLEQFGTVPLLGKAGKLNKLGKMLGRASRRKWAARVRAVQEGVSRVDAASDIYSDNILGR